MFENIKLPEYGINVINLNYLLSNRIELEISNFLYSNNLNLKLNCRDLNNVFKHFIISEILNSFKSDYNNVLIFNNVYNLKYLQNLYNEELCISILNDLISKSSKNFNFFLFFISNNFEIDKNTIYSFKQIIESKKVKNYRKAKNYCEKSNLTEISEKLRTSVKTKLILNK